MRAEKEDVMYLNYYFADLSRRDREILEMILLEEMESQAWFSVTCSTILNGEVFITLQ